jgi:putative ATP-dependent endonuclease of OLD family
MPILIDKVRISNYRSLHKVEIDLAPVTLLIGANNSGKTSFLRALNLALGIGPKRVATEDFYIKKDEVNNKGKEILLDVRIIPVDQKNNRSKSFDDAWREKQFVLLVSIDENDNEFFAFRTKVTYDIMKGEHVIDRFKIKEWKDESNWEQQRHSEELKQFFDAFPLFFIDAQRDIIQDLRDRNSYFGKLVGNIKIKDELVKEIEGKIKAINEGIVASSDELELLKQ